MLLSITNKSPDGNSHENYIINGEESDLERFEKTLLAAEGSKTLFMTQKTSIQVGVLALTTHLFTSKMYELTI